MHAAISKQALWNDYRPVPDDSSACSLWTLNLCHWVLQDSLQVYLSVLQSVRIAVKLSKRTLESLQARFSDGRTLASICEILRYWVSETGREKCESQCDAVSKAGRIMQKLLAVWEMAYETHLITQSSNPSSHRSRFMLPLPTRRYQVSKYWSKLIDKKSFQHLERENWGIVVILFFNADVDSPPVRGFLREAVPKIVDVWRVTSLFFTVLLNKSMFSGHVPAILKRADVRPLFKKGDRTVAKNYRPVSLLPVISKVLERIVQARVVPYFMTNSILPPSQFAYRKNHSTTDALFLAMDRLLEAKDLGKHSGLVLVDMSKAFDKVIHQRLIADLHQCGLSGAVLSWFISYLSDRVQRVVIPTFAPTQYQPCTCGVPQGSVLGPLLFSLYTREVPLVMSSLHVHCQMYADDIMLDYSSRDPTQIESKLSLASSSLADHLRTRGLILNAQKTQVMAVPSWGAPISLRITCNDVVLEQTRSATYLGFQLDDRLSGSAQVQAVRKKVWSKLAALWRARPFLTRSLASLYYQAVILPDILYAAPAYHSILSPNLHNQLHVLCKRSARCIMCAPPWAHAAPLFTLLNLKYAHTWTIVASL